MQGSWDYDYIESLQETGPTGPFQVSCWHRMRVSDNVSSTVTDSYFATAEVRTSGGTGLPCAPCDPLTLATTVTAWSPGNGTPCLSTRVYERDSDGDLNPVRSTYVMYDSDGPEAGPRQDRNHRLRYQKVLYHADKDGSGSPRWEETANSDFDGLGHYRGASRASSFGPTKSANSGGRRHRRAAPPPRSRHGHPHPRRSRSRPADHGRPGSIRPAAAGAAARR